MIRAHEDRFQPLPKDIPGEVVKFRASHREDPTTAQAQVKGQTKHLGAFVMAQEPTVGLQPPCRADQGAQAAEEAGDTFGKQRFLAKTLAAFAEPVIGFVGTAKLQPDAVDAVPHRLCHRIHPVGVHRTEIVPEKNDTLHRVALCHCRLSNLWRTRKNGVQECAGMLKQIPAKCKWHRPRRQRISATPAPAAADGQATATTPARHFAPRASRCSGRHRSGSRCRWR